MSDAPSYDTKLLERLRSGDKEALGEFIQANRPAESIDALQSAQRARRGR